MNFQKMFEIHITNIKRAVEKAPEAIKVLKQRAAEHMKMSHQSCLNMMNKAIKYFIANLTRTVNSKVNQGTGNVS